MKMMHLVLWKQKRKGTNSLWDEKAELVNVEDAVEALQKMMQHNASRLLATSDYRAVELETVLQKANMKIVALVEQETESSEDNESEEDEESSEDSSD